VQSDAAGSVSYTVTYHKVEPDDSLSPLAAALLLRVQSIGKWTPADDSLTPVEKTVEFVAELKPRVPGRIIGPGDDAALNDLAEWPTDWNTVQQNSLTALGVGSDPLRIQPRTRWDGDVMVKGTVGIFDFSGSTGYLGARTDLLTSIAEQYGPSGIRYYPHPVGGVLKFHSTPSSTTQSDLAALNVPWSVESAPASPFISMRTIGSSDSSYRVFEGGFTYSRATLSPSVSDTTLQPTSNNPLGLFYRYGDVTLNSGVKLIGTIISTGDVIVEGDGVYLAPANWSVGLDGVEIEEPELWPRLPALLCLNDDLRLGDSARATIDGAVAVYDDVDFDSIHYRLAGGGTLTTGTATAQIESPGVTRLTLGSGASLGGVSTGDEVLISYGAGRYWYRITGIDYTGNSVQIAGEFDSSAAAAIEIRAPRRDACNIYGPVFLNGGVRIDTPEDWDDTSSSDWYYKHSEWEVYNESREAESLEPIPFITWLESAINWFWSFDTKTLYGLGLEPVVHFGKPFNQVHAFQPPLFRPSPGDSNGDGAGYRWTIRSWREDP